MLRLIKAFVADYLLRHKNSVDRVLHIIGVPLAFFGIFQLFTVNRAAGFINIFFGYLLQWIGHTYFEKNEVGEWILIKKIIGKRRKK